MATHSGPAGSYSGTGSTKCTPCEKGKYSLNPGSAFCDTCPSGYDSYAGSTSCAICSAGYFLNPRQEEVQCDPCPKDASCKGGILLPIPDPGYYVDTSDKEYGDIVMSCPLGKEACDARRSNITCWAYTNFADEAACPSDLVCTRGYTGPLCNTNPSPNP